MKEFYEGKLKEMEETLAERVSERDQLLQDLENATGRTTRSSERLKAKLQEKEEQIAALKRMQENFRKQTIAAKQKAADKGNLIQLQNDVKLMKRRKADMQKELASEKRNHAKDVNMLNKVVMQKDREISKIQRASNRHEMDAQKAKQVSKTRLEELAHLKKTLKSYKRSAGLDPVLVGRRQSSRNANQNAVSAPKGECASSVDADLLRDFFDQKVAHVVRKEALVDKLAKEWEEYFELNTRLNELSQEPESDESLEALQTLEVQLQFQNDKIRKLAKRLGTTGLSSSETAHDDPALSKKGDSFLFDEEFSGLCSGSTPEHSRSTASKVLFGMIVRERRRVAALAKTASSLDERLHAAEKNVEASEAALRSYIDEHHQEVVELTQAHQDHILSLMDMVKVEADGASGPSEEKFQKKLLVLANERVALLEDELTELRAEKSDMEEFTAKLEEMKGLLESKTEECENLEEARNVLRTVLRQLRDEAAKYRGAQSDGGDDLGTSVVRMVDEYLHPASPLRLSPDRNTPGRSTSRTSRGSTIRSPRLKKHIELMHSSDSDSGPEDDEEEAGVPAWSNNIMADLALIAEGKVPKSLQSPKILDEASQLEWSSLASTSAIRPTDSRTNTSATGGRKKSAAAQSDEQLSIDTGEGDGVPSENDPHIYQSVFDRLGSPSHFTGTQKERFHDHEAKRSQSAEEAASRVLHNILDDKEDEPVNGSESHTSSEKPTSSSRSDYVKQNVFDRLQKTTTLAAAVRQNETLHNDSRQSGDNLPRISPNSAAPDNTAHAAAKPEPKNATVPAPREKKPQTKQSQNVFERLSKTTTEAYAKKTNRWGQEG